MVFSEVCYGMLDNQTLQNADAPLNLLSETTEYLTQMLLMRMERQWVTDYFTTTVWDDDVTPGNLWSDYANSDPVDPLDSLFVNPVGSQCAYEGFFTQQVDLFSQAIDVPFSLSVEGTVNDAVGSVEENVSIDEFRVDTDILDFSSFADFLFLIKVIYHFKVKNTVQFFRRKSYVQ